jgi:hypothetical protein
MRDRANQRGASVCIARSTSEFRPRGPLLIGAPAGVFNVSRSWEWNPKTDSVSYEGKDKDGKPVKDTSFRFTGCCEEFEIPRSTSATAMYWPSLPCRFCIPACSDMTAKPFFLMSPEELDQVEAAELEHEKQVSRGRAHIRLIPKG